MRKIIPWLLLVTLLCAGCGKAREGEALQTHYAAVTCAELTADVTCHLPEETRSFTVACTYDAGGDSSVVITAPAELAGITATVSGEDLTLSYGELTLAAGSLTDLCVANCLPWLLKAAASGYVLEEGRETLDGRDCLRLALDTTAPAGDKVVISAWFDAGTQEPVYGEFTMADQLVLTAEITSFRAETAPAED